MSKVPGGTEVWGPREGFIAPSKDGGELFDGMFSAAVVSQPEVHGPGLVNRSFWLTGRGLAHPSSLRKSADRRHPMTPANQT